MSPVRPSARVRTRSQASREKLKEEREQILLWKQPLTTVNYSTRELLITLFEWGKRYVIIFFFEALVLKWKAA